MESKVDSTRPTRVDDFVISKSQVSPNALKVSTGNFIWDHCLWEIPPKDPVTLHYVQNGYLKDGTKGWIVFSKSSETCSAFVEKGLDSWIIVPDNKWTVQPVSYDFDKSCFFINLGTKLYDSRETAMDHLWDIGSLSQYENLIFCGWVIARGGNSSSDSLIASVDRNGLGLSQLLTRPASEPLDPEVLKRIFRDNREYLGNWISKYLEFEKPHAEEELRDQLRLLVPTIYIDSYEDKISIEKTANFAGEPYFRVSLGGENLFE